LIEEGAMRIPLIAAGIILLIGSVAVAGPTDPDPDGIGIYLDQQGLANNVHIAPGVPVQLFVLLTLCSAPSGVFGWECIIEIHGNALVMGWNLAGIGPINFEQPPSFEVGLGLPTPWTPAILLVDCWLMAMDSEPILFFIHPGVLNSCEDDLPCYVPGNDIYDLRTMYPSSGSTTQPVFAINDGEPVTVVSATWGDVKAMYR
jgi:hypothetical protein